MIFVKQAALLVLLLEWAICSHSHHDLNQIKATGKI